MNWMGTSCNYRSGLPLNQTFCPIRTRIPINHSTQKEAEEQEEETPPSMVLVDEPVLARVHAFDYVTPRRW
jgi:hypothetical protein